MVKLSHSTNTNKYVSLQGHISYLYLSNLQLAQWSGLGNITYNRTYELNNFQLQLIWIADHYEKYQTEKNQVKMCKEMDNVKDNDICLNVTFSYENDRMTSYTLITGDKCVSWNEASMLCRDIGGYLPYFERREQQEEIAALFALLGKMPLLEAIYIGLNLKRKK